MNPYKANIESETLNNDNYRKVLFTGNHLQLVVMNLKVGEDIPMEVHPNIDQFIRVESGSALVRIDSEEFNLGKDEAVIIPAGRNHYVKNIGTEELKLYTIYGPAEHPEGTIHKTFDEAKKYEEEHHH